MGQRWEGVRDVAVRRTKPDQAKNRSFASHLAGASCAAIASYRCRRLGKDDRSGGLQGREDDVGVVENGFGSCGVWRRVADWSSCGRYPWRLRLDVKMEKRGVRCGSLSRELVEMVSVVCWVLRCISRCTLDNGEDCLGMV